jgi:hypothetical protein
MTVWSRQAVARRMMQFSRSRRTNAGDRSGAVQFPQSCRESLVDSGVMCIRQCLVQRAARVSIPAPWDHGPPAFPDGIAALSDVTLVTSGITGALPYYTRFERAVARCGEVW